MVDGPHHVGQGDGLAQRLSKCVMALRGCSRAEAERLIEAGWVSVDGVPVDDPAHRAAPAQVTVADGAETSLLRPVTVLWHQAAERVDGNGKEGLETLVTAGTLTRWHLRQLECMTPLPHTPVQATGLVVWVQDVRLQRAWQEQAALMEEEWRVEWRPAPGSAKPFAWPTSQDIQGLQTAGNVAQLKPLRGTLAAQRHLKASMSSQNAERVLLRLVMKGYDALALPAWLEAVAATAASGWQLAGLHRQRLGRLALGTLPPGTGRVLGPLERF